MSSTRWFPEIMYEEPTEEGGLTSNIPFIPVPEGEKMPNCLFIFESSPTGEYEPDALGEEQPVMELVLFQYANMMTLKDKLDVETFNKVRLALELEPLEVAALKGQKITDRIHNTLK